MASLTASATLGKRGRFLTLVATAPALLALAQFLPDSGAGLAIRLAAAAACVLLVPGGLIVCALGWPRSPGIAVAASFSFSLATVGAGLALVFLLGSSLLLAAAVLAAVALAALVPAVLDERPAPVTRTERRWLGGVLGLSVLYAGLVWWAARGVAGDGLFHLARVRKLAEFDSLSALTTVDEFKDGGLHPGYAFPLWQGVDALIARLAGVDSTEVLIYIPALLIPLALVLAYAAGTAIFRSPIGGASLVIVEVAYFGFFRRDAGAAATGRFETLAQPQAASLLLLTPALLALVFAFVVDGGGVVLAAVAAAGLGLSVTHPSYTPYVTLLIGGFLLARMLFARGWEPLLTRTALALGTIAAPFGLLLLLLLPVIRTTSGFTPASGARHEQLSVYGGLVTKIGPWYAMSPDAISRGGPLIVAGLLAVPLTVFATRRVWAALVVGGVLAILAVLLVPPVFTAFSDAFSLSQARRLPQFLPLPFAIVGGCFVLSRFRAAGVVLAAALGTALFLAFPGEFTYAYEGGGATWAVWLAVAGGIGALLVGAFRRTEGRDPDIWGLLAATALVLPLVVAGFAALGRPEPRATLPPDLVAAVRSDVPVGDVVFSDSRTAYTLAAYAPVYINTSVAGHVADTQANQVEARARAARRFFSSRSLSDARRQRILDRWGADWLVVDKLGPHPDGFLATLPLVYQDGRYALYRLEPQTGRGLS